MWQNMTLKQLPLKELRQYSKERNRSHQTTRNDTNTEQQKRHSKTTNE